MLIYLDSDRYLVDCEEFWRAIFNCNIYPHKLFAFEFSCIFLKREFIRRDARSLPLFAIFTCYLKVAKTKEENKPQPLALRHFGAVDLN
jgi:hypothetical protein